MFEVTKFSLQENQEHKTSTVLKTEIRRKFP